MRHTFRSVITLLVMLAAAHVGAGDWTTSPVGPDTIGAPTVHHRLVVPKTLGLKSEVIIDLCVQGAMLRNDTPGAAVAVMQDGVMTHAKGYGVKRRGTTDPVDADTYFRIGSVTKQLTAAAVMQQVELGAVDLEHRITHYVPELTLTGWWPATDIRVKHLLSHTSGYPDNFLNVDGPTDDEALARWAAGEGVVRLNAPAGTFWNYSNPNFSLAGLVVERASGLFYREYMESRVFDDAGLERTTFDPAVVIADGNWTFGHFQPAIGPEQKYVPDAYDSVAFGPAGFAFSTAPDLARWADLLMTGGGDVLEPDSVRLMQADQADIAAAPFTTYGFGIFHEYYDGLELHQHGGNIPGWGTYLLWIPSERAAISVLANTFTSLADAAYCIVDALYHPPGGEAVDLSPNPEKWPDFVGTYSGFNPFGTPLHTNVWLEDDALMAELVNTGDPTDRVSGPLISVFLDTFVFDLDGDEVPDLDFSFLTTAGTPSHVEWMVNRQWVGLADREPRTLTGRNGP